MLELNEDWDPRQLADLHTRSTGDKFWANWISEVRGVWLGKRGSTRRDISIGQYSDRCKIDDLGGDSDDGTG